MLLDNFGAWLHPDVGHLRVEHLGVRLLKSCLFNVPSATLDVKSVHVRTIGSLLGLVHFAVDLDLVVPLDEIDSDGVLSGIVLLQTGQE